MPKVWGVYWENGKNWCYGHGTRPKYCPDKCYCRRIRTPSPPKIKSPPKHSARH